MSLMKYIMEVKLDESYFNGCNLSFEAIMKLFQQVASNHANELGLGFDEMISKNLYWVLLRLKFDVIKMPLVDQIVLVETWPHVKGKIDFDRDFNIRDTNGGLLIRGTSKWCVIDSKSRMIQRTDKIDYQGEYLNIKNYDNNFDKISLLDDIEVDFLYEYKVSEVDIDENKHMNNANYARIVQNAINQNTYTHFEINFIKECLTDDLIHLFSISEKDTQYIIGKVNDKISFIIYLK